MSTFQVIKRQLICADDIESGDSFVTDSGDVWTASVDAYQDDTSSYVFIPVTRLSFGGMYTDTIIRLRGDAVVTVIKF